ncbi:MAG: hypothetical protein HZA88_10920 [Verrucomicrobia bacterium]|nr:hypothetical protein [Verrucomicrobiota bacterium]
MNSHIVADGRKRLNKSPEFQARLHELEKSIQSRYATELAKAGCIRRFVLRWRMILEYRRERRKLAPSPGSLFFNQTSSKSLPTNGKN